MSQYIVSLDQGTTSSRAILIDSTGKALDAGQLEFTQSYPADGWVEQAANEILAMGLAHLFASDAHGCHSRTPHMAALQQWVGELCEPEYAAILLEKNPRRLLNGRPMVGMDS